jgi:hypothetical protein
MSKLLLKELYFAPNVRYKHLSKILESKFKLGPLYFQKVVIPNIRYK